MRKFLIRVATLAAAATALAPVAPTTAAAAQHLAFRP